MIPRIIHQTWKSRDIPKHLRGYQESWLHKHPDWEYRLWDDAAKPGMNWFFAAADESAPVHGYWLHFMPKEHA